MPESDPPNVVSNLIKNVALPFAEGLEEELKGVGAELDREQHIASEFDKLEVGRTTGPEKTADGYVQRVVPTMDRDVPSGQPEFGSNTHVFFANGINTRFERAQVEATMLSARVHQPVDLVYVRTENPVANVKKAIHETFNHGEGKRNPPERALAAGIIESIDKGENVHVIGFSRGALVTQLAIEAVDDHYRAESHSSRWVVEHVNSHITVETFNGASHSMPEGVRAKHYVRDDDLLVAQSIGMGKYTPEVRGIAGAGIDSALALINELPPEKREAAARDYKDLVKTTDKIALDAGPMHATESLLGQPDGHLRQDLLHMRDDLRALSKDLASPPPAMPAADEIRRDGYYNTPNGPIVTVPPFLDASAKNPLQWVVDQHDLPQMLAFRQPFESVPAPHARSRDSELGVQHTSGVTGYGMTAFRHGKVVDLTAGYRQDGKIVDIDAKRVLQSVIENGQEHVITYDRRALESHFADKEQFAATIKRGKNVEIEIDHAEKAHAQGLVHEHAQHVNNEVARARTISRSDVHSLDR